VTHPRASFIVLVYNQEPYIKEAVSAVLSQNCEPLEILISDDRSSDRTWEIIQDLAAQYDGPHQIRLNQNEQNMGVNPHLNNCIQMVQGDIIIAASGDDISYPNRAALILDEFDRTSPLLVHSRIDLLIDGEIQPDTRHGNAQLFQTRDLCAAARAQALYIGATAAWSRELFDLFGLVPNTGLYEDLILGFRATLMDRVGLVDEPLLAYRTDVGISKLPRQIASAEQWQAHRHRELTRILTTYETRQADAVKAGLNSDHDVFGVLKSCQEETKLRLGANDLSTIQYLTHHVAQPLKALRILTSERRRRKKNLRRSQKALSN
jgi:glycosyltransferase involved in cell wall biosynthesis